MNVAAAINGLGQIIATLEVPATRAGHRSLLRWARRHGRFERCGVEGTGSYGAGLCRYLIDSGVTVIEVDRPNRQRRRRRGKSDTADAESAARAVLAGEATTIPKDRSGRVEALRMIRNSHRSATKAKTQTANQIKDLIATAPDTITEQLRGLNTAQRVKRCAAWRPGQQTPHDPTSSARYNLHTLARRWLDLDAEIKQHNTHLKALTTELTPSLLAEYGVGPVVAADLVIAAGENPDRLKTEASYAALCGTSPIDASSGKQQHHRLNRGGNRHANSALHTTSVVRWRDCPETHAYIAKQRAKGRTDAHIRRCIKRALARRFHHLIVHDLTRPS
jgi:transposase